MSERPTLAVAQQAIVRGLLPGERLLVATGLRPVARVDPTARTRRELMRESKKHGALGAALRWSDRWSAATDAGYAHDEPRRRTVDQARAAATGASDSLAVTLVRCWVDVPEDASWLYVTDLRWLVTTTVQAQRDRPTGLQSDSVVGLVRHLVDVVREQPDDGLPVRAADGSPATVVSWAAPRADVRAQANGQTVSLAFTDASTLQLAPAHRRWSTESLTPALVAVDALA